MKNLIQSGYIKSMEKAYIFTYDGELLQLVPRNEADTIRFEKIFFLNC